MTAPTAKEAATELRREIHQRERVYPRWVADGRLDQKEADRRAARMQRALEIVEEAARQEKAAGDLFGGEPC
jgi:hypothetical protein